MNSSILLLPVIYFLIPKCCVQSRFRLLLRIRKKLKNEPFLNFIFLLLRIRKTAKLKNFAEKKSCVQSLFPLLLTIRKKLKNEQFLNFIFQLLRIGKSTKLNFFYNFFIKKLIKISVLVHKR